MNDNFHQHAAPARILKRRGTTACARNFKSVSEERPKTPIQMRLPNLMPIQANCGNNPYQNNSNQRTFLQFVPNQQYIQIARAPIESHQMCKPITDYRADSKFCQTAHAVCGIFGQ